jgi:hypothetical protein
LSVCRRYSALITVPSNLNIAIDVISLLLHLSGDVTRLGLTYFLQTNSFPLVAFNKNCSTHLHTFGPLLQHSRFGFAHTNLREGSLRITIAVQLSQNNTGFGVKSDLARLPPDWLVLWTAEFCAAEFGVGVLVLFSMFAGTSIWKKVRRLRKSQFSRAGVKGS